MLLGEKEMTVYGCRILTVIGKDHHLLTAGFERLQILLFDVRSAVVTEETGHYRREDWDNSRAHEERVTALNSKRDRFAKWVTVLNRYSRPSAHVPRVIWP